MADDTTQGTEAAETAPDAATDTNTGTESIPYDRFQKVNQQAKDAKKAAQEAQARADALQRQLEERESAGLPEVEQMKRRLEAAEKRAEENERKAAEAESRVQRATKQSWVTAAAQAQNFADPSDAAAFLNLDEIEDEKDAERAVKRLAGAKKHLIKSDEPRLPGRVLENGRTPAPGAPQPVGSRTEQADRQWAEEVAPELKRMVGGWHHTSS